MSDPGVQAVRIGIPLIGYTKYTEPLPGILYRTKKRLLSLINLNIIEFIHKNYIFQNHISINTFKSLDIKD